MEITLWENFSKRKNSTKQPNEESGVIKNVKLKENTSLDSPTFILSGNIQGFTYARMIFTYYFVTSIVSISNGIYEINCEKDCLSTYKNNIGNSTQFVERSSSNYDIQINDNYLSQKQAIVNEFRISSVISSWDSTGCYVCRIAGEDGGSQLGISTYALTKDQLSELMLFSYGGVLEQITDEFLKEVFNPFQYILDVKWFPFSPSTIGEGTTNRIKLGKYNYQNSSQFYYVKRNIQINGSIQHSGVQAYFHDWRDLNPNFTQYKIFFPSVGLVDVSANDVYSGIDWQLYVDFVSGESTILLIRRISTSSGVFAQYNGTIGVEIPIAQLNPTIGNTIGGAVSSGLAFGSGAKAQGLLGLANTIENIIQPSVSTMGTGQGGIAFLSPNNTIVLYGYNYGSCEYPTSVLGRPLYQNKKISELSGYIQCSNASIEMASESSDKDVVNGYLNGGFYYE